MSVQSLNLGEIRSVAEITTPQAKRYFTRLCKHFQHRNPVTLDGASGRIVFAVGTCGMTAGESVLTLVFRRAILTL